MFQDHQLAAFSQPVASLPDTPNLPAQTLKERFDACPEELRESYNGLCAALDDISAARQLGFQRSAGVPADTVQSAIESVQTQVADAVMGVIPSGSVTGDKLADDVQSRLSAIESAAQTEAAARQQADAAEVTARQQADAAEAAARQQADNSLQSQINAHTTQIGARCELIFGSYDGDSTESRLIALGFQPKAVFVIPQSGQMFFDNIQTRAGYGGLALSDMPCIYDERYVHIQIVSNGFQVFSNHSAQTNDKYKKYFYIAFKA